MSIKSVFRAIYIVSILFLVAYFSWDMLPVAQRQLWRMLGLPVPPSSFTYCVEVTNAAGEDLIVTVSHINDLPDRVMALQEEHRREAAGWIRNTEVLLRDQESTVCELPSNVDQRIGLLLITARTRHDFSKIVSQRVFIAFRTWPWSAGGPSSSSRDSQSQRPLQTVKIESNDLVTLEVSDESRERGLPKWEFAEEDSK